MAQTKKDNDGDGFMDCLPSPEKLFGEDFPGLETLNNIIYDLDQQLISQDQKIEETLLKLIEATNGLSADNMYTNIKDAMDSLIHTSVLEECACLIPDSEDVNKFLKTINEHIASHPGSEDVVFQQLLYLASHEGLSIPVRALKLENVTASSLSLNTVSDTIELENDSIWEDLRGRLKKFYLGKLGGAEGNHRSEILKNLCVLYPVKDVWVSYKNLRCQQVNSALANLNVCKAEALSNDEKLQALCKKMPELFSTLRSMMEEDSAVFVGNVFENEVDLKTSLWEIYMMNLNDELERVLEDIWLSKKREKPAHANGHALEGRQRFAESRINSEEEQAAKTGNYLLSSDDVQQIIKISHDLSEFNQFYHCLRQKSSCDSTLAFKLPPKGRGHLKGVLKHKRDNSPRDLPPDFHRKGILPEAIPPPFGATQSMVSSGPSPRDDMDIVMETSSSRHKWQWFNLVDKVLPSLLDVLSIEVMDGLAKKQQDEDKMWNETNILPTAHLPEGHQEEGYYNISESTEYVIRRLNYLLTLEMFWCEQAMKYVKASFIKTTTCCMEKLLEQLKQRAGSFTCAKDGCLSVKDIYVLFSSVYALWAWLDQADASVSEDDTKKTFDGLCKSLQSVKEQLKDEIVLYHDRVMSTVILQDAGSNNWTDQKPFFEGDRCSFSIQMWNYHMCNVRSDIFSCLPPNYAQDLFTIVLSNSLEILTMRYNRVKPSYKRMKQFSADIILILTASMEFLLSAADSMQTFLPDHKTIKIQRTSTIHNTCTSLLCPLAVVSSPLTDLYKIFKKDFAQRKRFREDKKEDPSWLGWIWPDLFGTHQEWASFPDGAAVFIVIKLMSAQPFPAYDLVLQSILMRNSLLPVIIARATREQGDETNSEFKEKYKNLLVAIAEVLNVCHEHPKSLSSFLLAILERDYRVRGSDGMDDTSSVDIPLWMACVYELIKDMLIRTIQKAVSFLQLQNPVKQPPGFLEYLRQLPCGCRVRNKANNISDKDPDETFMEACKEAMTSLLSEVKVMSLSLRFFFYKLEQMLPDGDSRPRCAGIKVLSQLILRLTRSGIELEQEVTGGPVSALLLKQISQLGEMIFTLMMGNSPENMTLPGNLIHSFVKQNGEFVKKTSSHIGNHFTNKTLSECQNIPLEKSPLQYREKYYKMMARDLLHHRNARSQLHLIYRALSENVEWIQQILEIPYPLAGYEPTPPPSFRVTQTNTPHPSANASPVNPFHVFTHVGTMRFTQEQLMDFPVQWQMMLQSDIGLTKANFHTLLSHRHEMQDNAHLEESEKKAVRVLKSRYNLEQADLV